MIDLKLNTKRLSNHWLYYRWRYVVFLAVALVAANFLYSATEPHPPYERRVEVILVPTMYSSDAIDSWQQNVLCVLPPDQEEVSITATPVIEGQEGTIVQMLAAKMSAREGTIWILPKAMFETMATQGGFMELDGVLDSFRLPKDIDLSAGKAVVPPSDGSLGTQHVYGIPLDKFTGLNGLFAPDGMVLALPVYADANLGGAIASANYLFSKTEPFVYDPEEGGANRAVVTVAALNFTADKSADWQKQIQSALPAEQAVKFSPLPFYTGREAYVAGLIKSRAADKKSASASVAIVPADVFTALARQGALMDLEGISADLKLPEGINLDLGREQAVQKDKTLGPAKLYGIPLDQCAGLAEFFNPKGMVLVFPVQTGTNLDIAKAAANWILAKN